MGRKRPERKNQKLLDLIKEVYAPETTEEIQDALKDLTSGLIEEMLKAELDDHLEYDYGEKPLRLNTRNGYSSKTLKSTNGEMEIQVPRDREGSFEPQVVKKYERDISSIENQIISMYGRGMTTRDISAHIQEIYGFGLSESMVTKITNKILPTIEEWRQRPLEEVYPFVFMDAIHYNVRDNGMVIKKAVYIVLAYTIIPTCIFF